MSEQDNEWAPGDWNAQCFRCGTKRKASTMQKQWQGFYVCPEHWEPRQPQDFVRGVPDNPSVPWVQPDDWEFIGGCFCTPASSSATPGLGTPDCLIPSRTIDDTTFIPVDCCTLLGRTTIPSDMQPGCAIPSTV